MFCKELLARVTHQQVIAKYKSCLGQLPAGYHSYSILKNLKNKHAIENQQRYVSNSTKLAGNQPKHAKSRKGPILKPLEALQKYCNGPLLPKEAMIFDPTEEDVRQGQKLFLPTPDHKIEFLKSAVFTEHLPDYELPEVAFVGRSNVGKSSLISTMFSGVPDLDVRISKTPGHTKTLNFFQLGKKLSVVDMPGYGYRMPQHYVESVETFLHSRKKTFFLVDGEVGLSSVDLIGLNMMEEFQIPYVIVMTKIDKARPSIQLRSFKSVKEYTDNTFCFPQPFLVSSMTGDGVALLQAFVAYVSGNFKPSGMS